ncbi:hypothetical protein BXZ70DRAFT_1008327 [Cristinia sonorae]|uniref:Uncharacterized protein n=1 Tax=Cristinia sonorae TaxID=1940300 RepID=A0A8K0UMY4_9AGAR|nr:hypothetical protein BXZ70DRAFT_1008327 [Cristinia sonorae]
MPQFVQIYVTQLLKDAVSEIAEGAGWNWFDGRGGIRDGPADATPTTMSTALDHTANIYLTVTTSPSTVSQGISDAHPSLSYVGPVGSLADVHILSVPKDAWYANQSEILGRLRSLEGVGHVEVQSEPRTRAKRGGDEL